MNTKSYQYYYCFLAIVLALSLTRPALAQSKGQLGLGAGIAHGMLGLNGEILCWDHLGLTLGAGSLDDFTCWAAGVRYYLNKSERRCRLRVGCLYGVVNYIEDMDMKETIEGLFPFVGADLRLNKHIGFNVDFGYRIPSKNTTSLHGSEGWQNSYEYVYYEEAEFKNEKSAAMSLGLSYHF
jgi:hypothetical protein